MVTTSPFAFTGLTSDETAEEILLRAHRLDTRAMILASSGYILGIGGFPEDTNLAYIWLGDLPFFGLDPERDFLLAMQLSREDQQRENIGEIYPRMCALGRESFLVEPFRQAGLFDFSAYCDALSAQLGPVPPLDDKERDDIAGIALFANMTKELSRALTKRPLNKDDYAFLLGDMFTNYNNLSLWYAATSHDPATQSPDWQARRLLSFLEHNGALNIKEVPPETVRHYLFNQLSHDPALTGEIIRRAHAGDVPAMREMAAAYGNGSRAFPKNQSLADAWLDRAARHGDALSMLLLAMGNYRPGEFTSFDHAYVLLALAYGDTDIQASARQLWERGQKNLAPDQRGKKPWQVDYYLEEIRKNTGMAPLPIPGFD